MRGESVKVGKHWITVEDKLSFREWVENRYKDWSAFLELRKKDKEVIFLRWKWGFENENSLRDLETTEQQILHAIREMDISKVDDGIRFYVEKKRRFDRQCYEIKKEIGLAEEPNPEVVLF